MVIDSVRIRIADHESYILANRELFDYFFNTESWKAMRPKNGKSTYGCYVTKKTFVAPPALVILGEMLRDKFGYARNSSPLTILFHFKRRYDKLFNS